MPTRILPLVYICIHMYTYIHAYYLNCFSLPMYVLGHSLYQLIELLYIHTYTQMETLKVLAPFSFVALALVTASIVHVTVTGLPHLGEATHIEVISVHVSCLYE